MRALIGTFALALACGGGHRRFDQHDRDEIAAVLDEQARAWNAGDLAGFMAAYERDDALVFTSQASITRGWQATYDRYVARYGGAGRDQMGELRFEIVDIAPLGDDGVVVLGRWDLRGTDKAGASVFSLGMARRPGGWRIVHDHTSSAATP